MISKAQERFNNDYLYVRKELVAGRNPFVTSVSMKDWIRQRMEVVISASIEEREALIKQSMSAHADRELEIYHRDLFANGEKEEDD